MTLKIAIVEDDINMRKALEGAFEGKKEYEVVTYKHGKEALAKLDDSVDLVITDLSMPYIGGLELLRKLNGKYESIVITAHASLSNAVEAMRLGAKDFITKPFEIEDLITAIKRADKAKEVTAKRPRNKKEATGSKFEVTSKKLDRIIDIANKSAKTTASILLLGESGVGEEVFAKYIYENSPRTKKPFIAINMASIPENLIESELFGHVKGSFTDAIADKAGKFEEADGGTIFLDEIGEMPYQLQSKLLRALQEKEISRVGDVKVRKVDIRVIAATNRNIEQSVSQGSFREDLYYRLNTIPITIPPLRERKDEILHIANATLKKACDEYNFTPKVFSNDTKEALLNYNWPGNVRELIGACERAAILSDENAEVTPEDLFLQTRQENRTIDAMEKNLLVEALDQTNNDIGQIAKLLSVTEAEINRKLKQYNLI